MKKILLVAALCGVAVAEEPARKWDANADFSSERKVRFALE